MKNNLSFVGGFATYILFSLSSFLVAQNSPWQLRVGYENLFVRPSTTNNLAEKTWVWNIPDKGEVFSMRTGPTYAAILGIKYDLKKWVGISFNFKNFFRRYYVEDGTYRDGIYQSIPHGGWLGRDKFLGRTMTTTSFQLGLDFSHKISKNEKWRFHYALSLNNDLYEKQLQFFDTPINFDGESWYIDAKSNERREVNLFGPISFKANNPGRGKYQPSTNLSLGLSRKGKNGMGFTFEMGFRNILWINNVLLKENHIELDLQYIEQIKDDDGNLSQIFSENTVHKFPLYLGGLYSNFSFTFRPFRSPRDKDNYISPWQKVRRVISRRKHKKMN